MRDDSYNSFDRIDEFSYNCISYLMENNELIWKLLYYNDPDAYDKTDLTQPEKASLIYDGSPFPKNFGVFMDGGNPDAIDWEKCILRIVPYRAMPENYVVGTLSMSFEVYCHYKVNTLDNYKTRIDVITREILKEFNGFELIGGIGKLYFDRMASQTDRMLITGQLPYKGKQIIMSTKVA